MRQVQSSSLLPRSRAALVCVVQKTPAFAEVLCTPRCGFSGTTHLTKGRWALQGEHGGLSQWSHSRNLFFPFPGCAEVPEDGRSHSGTGAICITPQHAAALNRHLGVPRYVSTRESPSVSQGGGGWRRTKVFLASPSFVVQTEWVATRKTLRLTQEQQLNQWGLGRLRGGTGSS